jgi:cysteine-rich repeat protein
MRHGMWWMVVWLLGVLASAEWVHAADPPRTLNPYVVLGLRRAKLKNLSFVQSGLIGANQPGGTPEGGSSLDGVRFGRRVFMNNGTAAVADTVRLGVGTSIWDAYANTILAPDATIRNVGPTPFAVPIVATIPPLPAFAPGTVDVVVLPGGTATLAPGAHGLVRVMNQATLILNGGTYEAADFLISKRAKVLVYGPITLNIAGKLRVGDVSTFGPATNTVGAQDLQVNIGGRSVRFGASANVTMFMFAPNAYLALSRTVTAKGQFIANIINTDHSATFSHPVCGDGAVDPGEACDDGNTASCDGCSAGCDVESCGDGILCTGTGEQCDDGNIAGCDGCSPACQTEFCGDGVICPSEGESCDPPQCGVCGPTCTAGPTCGDGILDPTCAETCDDGNALTCDGCSPACQPESCGDGTVCTSQGEQCDPPAGGGACPTCTPTCQNGPVCGNGLIDAACGETCDDGNNTPCDGCTGCQVDTCGDGITCPALGEQCDDANGAACDGCSNCQLDRCGDGLLCASQGEQCDDANIVGCDGCSAICRNESCGDGIVCASQGEQCDDANGATCDGCSNCQTDFCGDGIVCASLGEDCDPPNMVDCDATCHLGLVPPTYCTLSQDAYGAIGGRANDPVTGLVTNNPSILPVTVGATGDLSLTIQDQTSLQCMLPTTGGVEVLCTGLAPCGPDELIDACSNPPILDPNLGFTSSGGQGSGVLAGEAIGLNLSVALSDLGATTPNLKDFVLQQAFCVMDNGSPHYFLVDPDIADGTRTVADLLVLANQALRDATSFQPADPITRQEIAEALHNVSDAFDGCRMLCSASGAFIDGEDGVF